MSKSCRWTQYFNDDKEQKLYGKLGAMRLPKTPEYQNY